MIEVAPGIGIDEEEIRFVASRSGGPGGQNVNKVNTKVTVLFDLEGWRSIGDGEKLRIRGRLGRRVNGEGILRVSCRVHRTQEANRREALERLVDLIREALREDEPRVPTRIPATVRRRRLENKRRRGALKRRRSADPEGE